MRPIEEADTLFQTLLIMAAAWLILSLVGWLVLGQFTASKRNLLLPAAPLIGAAALVAVLHYTTLITSVRVGLWFVAGAAGVLLVLNFRKDRRWWATSRSALGLMVLAAALGAIPATAVLYPSKVVGDSRVVQLSNANDAFYYVTVVDWVTHNRGIDRPVFHQTPQQGGAPMSYVSASSQIGHHLRIGDELTQSAINVVLGKSSVDTWYPLSGLWILLLPAAGLGAARCLRMRAASGLILGVAIATSSLTLLQLANQNSDSLLGVALAPFAVAAVVQALDRSPIFGRVFAALMLAALLGTYAEFTPLILPALILAVFARRPSNIWPAARSALIVVGLSIAIAPLAWSNAFRSLVFIGQIAPDHLTSPFSGATRWETLNRFTGTTPFEQGFARSWQAPLLALALVVGVALAAVFSRRRLFMVVLAGTGAALAYDLAAVKQRPYSQLRTIEIWIPLLLLVAAFGFDRLYQWWSSQERPEFRRFRVAVLVAAVLPGLLWIAVNERTSVRMVGNVAMIRARHVDSDFAQAAGWLSAVDGPKGSDSMVLAPQFFDQLWITQALRSKPLTAYPFLYISYQGYSRFWDGKLTRWLLVDDTATLDADPGTVVRTNARFKLVDLTVGQVAVGFDSSTAGHPSYFVMRTPGTAAKVRLTGHVVPAGTRTPLPGPRAAARGELKPGTLHPDTTFIDVPLPATPDANLSMSDGTSTFIVTGMSREATT
ncbi:hypothetical protein ACSMXN_21410 [Jatrophihabitans sp. DSM 45814]